jgi:4-oxalocrotonate tautomerase
MPLANFKFPQGLLNKKQKEEIIHKTTDMFTSYLVRACVHTQWC